ncbi:MAG: hypothetical protein WC007_03225 [Pelobacteraceae bacterium]
MKRRRQLHIRKQSRWFVTLAVFAILAFNGILAPVCTPHENSKERNSAISKTQGITSHVHLAKYAPFIAINQSSYVLKAPVSFTALRFIQHSQSAISLTRSSYSTRAPPV